MAPSPDQRIVLVRHGDALSEAVDPARPLSEAGEAEVARVARWAAAVGLQVDEIRHSGKRRAEQTAEAFAAVLQPTQGVRQAAGLAPNDNVEPIAESLAGETSAVMIVGHMPFLGKLASRLVLGSSQQEIVALATAGLVELVRYGPDWYIHCVMTPDRATA